MTSLADQREASVTPLDAVRALYERRPYPPPERDLDAYRDHRRTIDGSPRSYFHLYWPHASRRDDLDVLVAGCGTSQAAKLALQNPASRVTGIDLSAASLGCTATLAERYGLSNLTLHRLPVERVAELDRSFDLVVSTGVLHHLPDPDAGLRALRGVLRPGGAMHLMVYARYGRAGVYMMQEYCRRLGIDARGDEPEQLLAMIERLPPGHPLALFRRQADDLAHATGVADALLHPQDRAYTVPEIHGWLERGGMRHVRWFLQAPYSPQCGFAAGSPHARRLLAQPEPERHAAMELLRGTMITHTFVAVRDDRDPVTHAIDFAGDRWLDFVPRPFEGAAFEPVDPLDPRPGTAPGVVGTLRHPAHADADLAVPLPMAAARLYEAVDGRRTIREITAAAAAETRPADDAATVTLARVFFEMLWRSDLVTVGLG